MRALRRSSAIRAVVAIVGAALVASPALAAGPGAEVRIPLGRYLPFFSARPASASTAPSPSPWPMPSPPPSPRPLVEVGAFRLDAAPVTNREYLAFVARNRDWRRDQVPRAFADESYLKHWAGPLEVGPTAGPESPVTRVSWFAASAYCQARGRELPTNDQWEYAADDAGRDADVAKSRILDWYGKPNPRTFPRVRKGSPNGYGVHDLCGLVWEWTLDFNDAMPGAELRSDGTKDESLSCGAGSLAARDPADYARFMRYSFRESLRADFTTANLGFRCARKEID